MSDGDSESSRETEHSHTSSWWSRLQDYFEEAIDDYNQSGQEDLNLRDQLDYANQSNAEEVPEAFSEDVSRVSNYEKRRSTSTYKVEREMYEKLTKMEQPSCCMRGLRKVYHWLTSYCCNFDVKVFYKKPILWNTPAANLPVGFLIRENCLGIIGGIIVGFLAFGLFLMTFGHAMHIATLASCYVMLFAVFGISFSEDIRCVFMLVLPYLVAARARWLLMVFATVLTTMGPGLNFLHNSGNFRNAIGCVLGQVNTNLRLLDKITEAPMSLFGRQVKRFIDHGNEQLQRMRNMLGKIKFSLLRINRVMRSKNSWIKTLIAACGDDIALKNQCLAFFNALYFNCLATMSGARFVCKLVRLFAGESCVRMEGLNNFCQRQGDALQSQLNDSTSVTPEQIEESEAALLNIIGRNNVSMESGDFVDVDISSSLSNKEQITGLIEEKMDVLFDALEVFKNVLSWFLVAWTLLTVAQLVFQAALFRRKWMRKVYYDNVYLTPAFIRQEKHALQNQLIMTLPLSWFERRRYVHLSSFWWSKTEKRAAFGSLVFILVGILSIVMVMLADYTMYLVLITTGPAFSSDFGNKGEKMNTLNAIPEFGKAAEDRIQPKIEGNSTLTSMAKALLDLANPLKDIAFDVDASVCRPKASPPNTVHNRLIVAAIIGMLMTIVFQVYIMRLRHVICGWYYPQRETDRAGWLRAYIRNSRGLANRMVHRFRTRDIHTQRGQARLPFIERYLLTHPGLAWYLGLCGVKRAYCVSCGDVGKPNNKVEFNQKFTQCSECAAYYCLNCQVDLKNMCMTCRIPLNVLKVDVDLEKLSSEEEMEYFCGKYLKRNPHDNFRVPPEELDFDTMVKEYDKMWKAWREANGLRRRQEVEEEGVSDSSSEHSNPDGGAPGGGGVINQDIDQLVTATQPFPIPVPNTQIPVTVDVAQAEKHDIDMISPGPSPLPTDQKEGIEGESSITGPQTPVNMETVDVTQVEKLNEIIPSGPSPLPTDQKEGIQVESPITGPQTPVNMETVDVTQAEKLNEMIPPGPSPLPTDHKEGTQGRTSISGPQAPANMESAPQPNPIESPQAEMPEPVAIAQSGKINKILPPSLSPLPTSNQEQLISSQDVPAHAESAKVISSGTTQEIKADLPIPPVSTSYPVVPGHAEPAKGIGGGTAQEKMAGVPVPPVSTLYPVVSAYAEPAKGISGGTTQKKMAGVPVPPVSTLYPVESAYAEPAKGISGGTTQEIKADLPIPPVSTSYPVESAYAEPAKGISGGTTQEKIAGVPVPPVSTVGPAVSARTAYKSHEFPINAVKRIPSRGLPRYGRPVSQAPAVILSSVDMVKVAETKRRPESGDKGKDTRVSKVQRTQPQPRMFACLGNVKKQPPHPNKEPRSVELKHAFTVKGETSEAGGLPRPRMVPSAPALSKTVLTQKTQSKEDKRLVTSKAKRLPARAFDEDDMDVDTAFDDPMLRMELSGLDRKRTRGAIKEGDAERGLKVTRVFDEYDMEVDTAMQDSALTRAIESDGLYDKPLFGRHKRKRQTVKGNRKGLPAVFEEDDMSVDDAMNDPRLFDDVKDDVLLKADMSDVFLREDL